MYKNISKADQAAKINAYLLNAVDGDNYGVILGNDREKINFVMDCFNKEYSFPDNLKRYPNDVTRFTEWIQGLPGSFNIDYENYRILEIAIEWESMPANATEGRKDQILLNWFNYIANKTFQLHRKLNSAAALKAEAKAAKTK